LPQLPQFGESTLRLGPAGAADKVTHSMAAIPISPPHRLPVWQSVRASYAIVARNLGQLARIVWLWLLIMVPVQVALSWLEQAKVVPAGAQTALGWAGALAEALPVPIELPFLASIAVAWHRLVLRQERVTRLAYLRFDRVVWRYTLYSFAVFVLPRAVPVSCAFVLLVVNAVLPDAMLIDISTAEPFIAMVMAAVLLLLPRLALVLPATALGEALSLRRAWRSTRANTLRLGLATFLCVLPAVSIAMLAPFLRLLATAPSWLPFLSLPQVISLHWAMDPTRQLFYAVSGSLAGVILVSLAYVCLSIFGITLLSLTYRFFVASDHANPP